MRDWLGRPGNSAAKGVSGRIDWYGSAGAEWGRQWLMWLGLQCVTQSAQSEPQRSIAHALRFRLFGCSDSDHTHYSLIDG